MTCRGSAPQRPLGCVLTVPRVRWTDVGGLDEVVRQVVESIELPLRRRQQLAGSLRRVGVLLYGPPGTGKTLLARAVANECTLNLLSVKGPELIDMYVGQSEHNVRSLFERARAAAPALIFLDEVDALAPARGHAGDSAGVMDRLVAQLLSELDGLAGGGSGCHQVFVLAATNRPDLLDRALLRPGRLDRLLFVRPTDPLQILRAHCQHLPLAADCATEATLEQVAAVIPQGATGADVYSLCAVAAESALRRAVQSLEELRALNLQEGESRREGQEESQDVEVEELWEKQEKAAAMQLEITLNDLLAAAEKVVPSVTVTDMANFEAFEQMLNVR